MNKYSNWGAETRLSRLPKLNRTASPQIVVCGACNGNIEADNEHLQRLKVCRSCLDLYSKIDSVLDAAAHEKTQAQKLAIWGAKC